MISLPVSFPTDARHIDHLRVVLGQIVSLQPRDRAGRL